MKTAARPHPELRPRRSRTDRLVAGVAGGLGRRLGIDPMLLRLAFAVLALAGGFGVALYAACWMVSTPPDGDETSAMRPAAGVRQVAEVGLVVFGLLLILRAAGVWFGGGLVWPAAVAALGSAVIWARGGPGQQRLARLTLRLGVPAGWLPSGESVARLILGALLIFAGIGAFLASHGNYNLLQGARSIGFALLAAAAGAGLILGPGLVRTARQLSDERRERIRQEERAEVAAHLHDSVLQTLALIQRAGSPREMAALARGQERELRGWLYGRDAASPPGDSLSAAIDAAAAEVERAHRVPIDAVTVGDAPLDERLRPLVEAATEAMRNAAVHSGAGRISVFAEATGQAATVFVRDEGSGFDPSTTSPDRRGLRESIVGRMTRNGGQAILQSRPGEGTEVELRMPLDQP